MSHQQTCPDKTSWNRWLRSGGEELLDRNTPPEQSDLTQHLDHCERCQQQVAEFFDDDDFASQSRAAFRSSGLTSRDWTQPVADDSLQQANDASNPAVVSIVQALLGPTDDENSLGRLGRFEILGLVGSGGMGIVLKARSMAMDRIVAIKIPLPQYWQARETLLTLEREARSAAAVVHPNVIAIYHVDRYKDVPYLVMPYLPGQSLEQRIRRSGPIPIDEALRIARQVSAALSAAHACGVVHRDVKPANILLGTGTERVVLTDFGVAKIQSDATCTATGTFAGTPIYLSPEQAAGLGAGPASDMFSLGTVIWTMLCGSPPLAGMHTHAIVRQIADAKMPDVSQQNVDIPDWLCRLINSLHAKDPSKRPSADQLSKWIESCQRHRSEGPSAPLPTELQGELPGRHWTGRLVISIAAVALLLIGWIIYSAIDRDDAQDMTFAPIQAASPVATADSEPSSTNSAPDQTDAYLNELRAELDELDQQALPRWESEIEKLIREAP